ncbi:hypothetical protein ACXN5S_19560 [Pseudoroseicyclus sp. H15]
MTMENQEFMEPRQAPSDGFLSKLARYRKALVAVPAGIIMGWNLLNPDKQIDATEEDVKAFVDSAFSVAEQVIVLFTPVLVYLVPNKP